jgi:hypothetical protein
MASTRNKNMCGNYYLEHKQNIGIIDNRLYEQRRYAYHNALPDAGINVGHMPNSVLSRNATDLESSLFGIGSTNLTEAPKEPVYQKPELNNLPSVAFFDRLQVFIPEPLVIEKDQRPQIP